MITAIIVDDQKNFVTGLRRLLESKHPDIKIAAVCYSIKEFEKALHEFQPDLIFLDVELEKNRTSFDVLKKISPINFEIIFTTSYEKYALQALRLSAIDYLLKPIDEEELSGAMEKFRSKKSKIDSGKIESLLTAWANPGNQQNKIPLPTATGYDMFTIAAIIYFKTNGDQTSLVMLNDKIITVHKTLKECEDILAPYRFFRIHKSYLVNLTQIKKYIKGKDGTVIMSNDDSLTVSRSFKEEFIPKIKDALEPSADERQVITNDQFSINVQNTECSNFPENTISLTAEAQRRRVVQNDFILCAFASLRLFDCRFLLANFLSFGN